MKKEEELRKRRVLQLYNYCVVAAAIGGQTLADPMGVLLITEGLFRRRVCNLSFRFTRLKKKETMAVRKLADG